ncbi:MAG: shikimate dehydrogenase [Sedimentisphaerales bacterium]|nr:shikimate dehydrogenase [Sedimentisphaerales bacterium]
MTPLAVPIAAKNLDQAEDQAKKAIDAGAEMLELRTDYLEVLSTDLVKSLIAAVKTKRASQIPIIVTCRDKLQGGAIAYSDTLRVDVLTNAVGAGAEFVDFEYEKFLFVDNQERIKLALSQSPKSRLILSAHNFESKFDNIEELYRHILTVYPPAIPKLVYTANHINDCFEAFDLLHKTNCERIVWSMGTPGLISRIIAKKLGSFLTYASIDDKNATAPGQLTIGQLKNLYRWNDIDCDTELYGIIGSPVAHSQSPAVHNTCFSDSRMNKLYLPLLVEGGKENLDRFLNNILARSWLGFRGFSVTIPHKQNALDYVKAKQGFVEPLAEKIGAVNTLVINEPRATSHEPRISAYNTDYTGAMDAITSAMDITRAGFKDITIAVIGAGGVARAVVAALTNADAKIKIYNRTLKKAEKLAQEFNCDFAPLDNLPGIDAKLLINCTSIGMHPNVDETPLPKKCLREDMAIFDTVYNPAETLLLRQAKQAGAKTITGLSMFINQAAAQFKLFTGQDTNFELMQKIVEDIR